MVNFIVFDLVFLVAFTLFVIVFLYTRRSNLQREGILYLYRTKWGIKLINYVGGKYKKTLHFLSYISVISGYTLMAIMVYLLVKLVYWYIKFPQIVQAVRVPPVIPLIPYLPRLFNIDFLPPFYFTYWILILAVVAIVHEFAHGIFARLYKIKIKSTGFGFLGPFLAAFVELDEPKMAKKPKFQQLAILSAGTFANVLTTILFFFIIIIFFNLAFTPAGVVFDGYSTSVVGVSTISFINGIAYTPNNYGLIANSLTNIEDDQFINIKAGGHNFLATKEILESQELSGSEHGRLVLYGDAPAINSELVGAITQVNDVSVTSREELGAELARYAPGDEIKIATKNVGAEGETQILTYDIVLESHPEDSSRGFLGISFSERSREGIFGKVYSLSTAFRDSNVYYEPSINPDTAEFIYDFLWWLVLINISVALVNMLPVGIFDGGRFFYLTVWGITGKEKIGARAFSWATWIILLAIFVLMWFWAVRFF